MQMTSKETLLLLGFGDIAKRLSDQLREAYTIVGVRRRPNLVEGVEVHGADCRSIDDMRTVLRRQVYEVIVITMTPSEISDEGYRKAYVDTMRILLSVLEEQSYQPRLIIFVSSTSVYGQQNAEWVDELSATEPTGYNGKRLLEAEGLLNQSPYKHCVVRFSGIYGPNRCRLIEQVVQGYGTTKEPVVYGNRIHVDDCVGVLAHIIEKQKYDVIDSLYLASDSAPSARYTVKQWLAEQLGYDDEHLQVKPLGRTLSSNKRCVNKRLLDSGYQFYYPTFQEGYRMVLDGYTLSK